MYSIQKVHQRIPNVRENHENQVVSAIVRKNPKFVTLEDLFKNKKIPVAHGESTPLECDTKR